MPASTSYNLLYRTLPEIMLQKKYSTMQTQMKLFHCIISNSTPAIASFQQDHIHNTNVPYKKQKVFSALTTGNINCKMLSWIRIL